MTKEFVSLLYASVSILKLSTLNSVSTNCKLKSCSKFFSVSFVNLFRI